MSFGLDEQLNKRSFNCARRVAHQSAEVQALHVEAFEMMQDSGSKVCLTHSWGTVDKNTWSECSHFVKR